jgi:hypothetical protein
MITGVETVAVILTALGVGSIITAIVTACSAAGRAGPTPPTSSPRRRASWSLRCWTGVREQEAENKRLRHRIEDMESDLRWLRAERGDQIRRDALMQRHMKALDEWTNEWLPRARELGLMTTERPRAPDLIPLMDSELLTHPHPRDRGERQ